MATFPNPPYVAIPLPAPTDTDPTLYPFPALDPITTVDLVGPLATNRQHNEIYKGTTTLLAYVNEYATTLNALSDIYLQVDGSLQNGVYGMTGDLPLGGNRIRNLAMWPTTTNRGAWSSVTAYSPGDYVTYGGGTYTCIQANTNVTPAYDNTAYPYWDVVAFQGATRSYVDTETTRAEAAEGTLTTNLASETTRAEAAEGTLTTNLASEVSTRTSQVGTLTTNLSSEATTRAAADATNATNISNEITRATTAEGTLTTNLTTEASSRASGDAANAAAISTETSRAEAAEGAGASNLQGQCTANAAAIAAVGAFSGIDGAWMNGTSITQMGEYEPSSIVFGSRTIPGVVVARVAGNVTISGTVLVGSSAPGVTAADYATAGVLLNAILGPPGTGASSGGASIGNSGTGGGGAITGLSLSSVQRLWMKLRPLLGGYGTNGGGAAVTAGGGCLILLVDGNVDLTGGTIVAHPQTAPGSGDGGGGGGCVIIICTGTLTGAGATIDVQGGVGNVNGGGGGGGYIALVASAFATAPTTLINGGANGGGSSASGTAGLYDGPFTYTADEIRSLFFHLAA